MTHTQQIYVPYDFKVGLVTSKQATEAYEVPNLGQVAALAAGLNSTKAAVRTLVDEPFDLSAGGLSLINGITVVADDRVLVINQADKTKNGIYLAKEDAWVRSEDADTSEELKPYTHVSIAEGDHAGERYFLEAESAPVIGTDEIVFKLETVGATLASDIAVDTAGWNYFGGKGNVKDVLIEMDARLYNDTTLLNSNLTRLQQLIGSAGNVLPDFSGTLIPAGSDVFEAIQALETATEASVNKYEQSKFTTPIDVLVQPNAWTAITHSLAEAFVSSVGIFDSDNSFENITHAFKWRPVDGDANAIEIYHSLATPLNVRVTVRK